MAGLTTEVRGLREQRAKLVSDARSILDSARAASRELTAEEQSQWDRMMTECDNLQRSAERLERQAAAEASVQPGGSGADVIDGERQVVRLPDGRMAQVLRPGENRNSRPLDGESREKPLPHTAQPEYREAFRAWLREGRSGLTGKHMRAIQQDTDTLGGYLVAPQQFVQELLKSVDNMCVVRMVATKFQLTGAQSLGVPTLDADPDDADWTSELATGSEDSTMAFGKREFRPHPLAKRLKVSKKLLRSAAISGTISSYDAVSAGAGAEGIVLSRLAYKFAVSHEKAFMTGNGDQRPLGLFTASSRGISTGRDVDTGSATNFTADKLIEALFAIKDQYRAKSQWLFNRTALTKIRQLSQANYGYLWQPGIKDGAPDTLLGRPVMTSEYAPNTFSAGNYVGLIGDFSYYWIVDALDMQVERLEELYAETNQVGFIGRMETDGTPVMEEAFARLQCTP